MFQSKGYYRSFYSIFLIILVLTAAVSAQTKESPQNEAAVKQLTERGQYDSLVEAFKNAQQKEDGGTSDFAVGQTSSLIAADGEASDRFGSSVAIDGMTAVIGVPNDDSNRGSVYIFVRNGTLWTLEQKLTASDGQASEVFGNSVAISGNTIIVGAVNEYDTSVFDPKGAAYIFSRSGGVWQQDRKITASDRQIGDRFGASVAISGNAAAVGTPNSDIGATGNQGAVYIFTGAGTLWVQQAKITVADGESDDHFGWSVALEGGNLIVGVPFDDISANANQGSAYIFEGSGATWIQQVKLTDLSTADARFGHGVAISGNRAVIGVPFEDFFGIENNGGVWVAERTGGVWSIAFGFAPQELTSNDRFGYSVGISGDLIVVGAEQAEIHGTQGAAYLYKRNSSTGTWFEQQRFNSADGTTDDAFGRSVAISGNFVIAGSPIKNIGTNSSQGAAYVFKVLTNNWEFTSFKPNPDEVENALFGYSIAISDDLAVVGAPTSPVGGRVYVFGRIGNVWNILAFYTAGDPDALFGNSVAVFGNRQNGLVVFGSPGFDGFGNPDQGLANVARITNGSPSSASPLEHPGAAAGDFFGNSVAVSNDTIIVGAPFRDVAGQANQGAAYIFKQTASGTWTFERELTAFFGEAGDDFGIDVDIFGNTAIVGARYGGSINQGSAHIFTRPFGLTNWTEQAELTANDGASFNEFGTNVAMSGNTVLVSQPLNQGVYVFVFSFDGTSWAWRQQQKIVSPVAEGGFGSSIDLDGNTAVIADFQQAFVFERGIFDWSVVRTLQYGESNLNTVSISGDKILVGMPQSDSTTPVPLAGNTKQNLAANQGGFSYFVNSLVPTAANVSVGGRVLTSNGIAVKNAIVTFTTSNGETVSVRTNPFGNYRFGEIEVGQTVTLQVRAKGLNFQPRVLKVNDELTDFDIVADNLPFTP